MADSKKDKSQQIPDTKAANSFADDLDSMLDLDASPDQQVGLIDDDDAIDRLLIGDVFEEQEDNPNDSFSDIDQLLATEYTEKPAAEIDEFADDIDDLIANTEIIAKPDKALDVVEIPPIETLSVYEEVDTSALERVGEIDEFSEDIPPVSDLNTQPKQLDDEFEKMTEIDEFSEEPETANSSNADFLLADFDISSDDLDPVPETEIAVDEPDEIKSENLLSTFDSESADDLLAEEEERLDEPVKQANPLSTESEISQQTETPKSDTNNIVLAAEHIAAIANLTAQVQALTKQQTILSKDLHLKPNQEELNACLESVDVLQTEQKKTKRSLDGINAKKPVSAYVANGVAAAALLIGIGLAVQVYIANSQVAQLVEMMSTLQTQVTTGPTADAAEKEMLQKQVDELTRLNSANAEQIAELSKTMHGGGDNTTKPSGDLGNQITQLSNQDMQMGATIESLQHKIAALEKGKAPVVTAKPAPKKPEPVKQNWTVNLVAFKQDWYAKRKAEEFAAKGVPAKVTKTETKGENWYRLSVDGFSTQYEAAAYAARVKKTLNLDSVWINVY